MRSRLMLACLAALMAVGCATPSPLEPRPDALAPFSTALREAQPDDAFAAVYPVGEAQLVWIGAKHATRTDSLTFHLINDAYKAIDFDLVIVEGCPTSWGLNSDRLRTYAEEGAADEKDGFQQRGEIVPAVMGALAQGADILCGEPDDVALKGQLLGAGFTEEDLLGFYVLRTIPQWARERRIKDAGDPAIAPLLAQELERNRQRLQMEASVLPSVESWSVWYRATNGVSLGTDFSTEHVGPLIDGPFESNRIAAAISRARAEYLHGMVIDMLNSGQTTLVVFGASHLMIHRPALDTAIGASCLLGAGMDKAAIHDCL